MPAYNAFLFQPAVVLPVDPLVSKCAALRTALPQMQTRDQDFARSLADGFFKYGRLSKKQVYWVDKLLERAASATAMAQARVTAPLPVQALPSASTPVAVAVSASPQEHTQLAPQFTKVMELFARARAAGLSWPKIRLVTPNGSKVVLSQYGPQHCSFPGHLAVTNGAAFGSTGRRFFGRISPEGEFSPGKNDPRDDIAENVAALLLQLGENPAGLAKLQGRLTDSCMFCGRGLLTKESVAVGYGPICADKFGLPWGEKTVETVVTLRVEEPHDCEAHAH